MYIRVYKIKDVLIGSLCEEDFFAYYLNVCKASAIQHLLIRGNLNKKGIVQLIRFPDTGCFST